MVYSWGFRKTGSLAAPILAHAVVNLSYSLLV